MDSIKYMFPKIKFHISYNAKIAYNLQELLQYLYNWKVLYAIAMVEANKFCPRPENGGYILFFMFFFRSGETW